MDVDRFAFYRPFIAEHFHTIDKLNDAIGLLADQPRQRTILVAGRLFQQLGRATNA